MLETPVQLIAAVAVAIMWPPEKRLTVTVTGCELGQPLRTRAAVIVLRRGVVMWVVRDVTVEVVVTVAVWVTVAAVVVAVSVSVEPVVVEVTVTVGE